MRSCSVVIRNALPPAAGSKPVHVLMRHPRAKLAWLISRTAWTERTQAQAVRAAIAVYVLAVVAALVISVAGAV